MDKEESNTVAKRCLHFDSKAPRKRRSKKSLKSPSRGLPRTENDDSIKASEKEGATLTIPETEPPNDGDNLDGTHTTPSSPVPFDSPASRTGGALQRLASKGVVSPIVEVSQGVGKDLNEAEPNHTTLSSPVPTQLPKKRRGPTKMKTLATEECDKVNITFNKFGQPIGEASVGLSSFLGPLVREVVPMTLNDWRKLSTRYKEILWTSIQAESAKFKSMKKRQLPHTCSRKGYARLVEDMKKNSTDSSSVTRVALWTKAHRKKDGTPVNSEVAETLERINEIEIEGINISSKDMTNDAISKVLGPDRDHIRAFGFGVTISNFSLLSQKDDHYAKLEEKCEKMEVEMTQMRSLISHLLKSQGNGSDQLSNATNDQVVNNVATNPIGTSPPSINNNNTLRKCTLLDWGGIGEVVAEGRWSSNDPNVIVHHVPLGPHAVRVWVDLPKKLDTFLWRPNSEMTYIEDAVGSTVAWPLDKVILS
ncbi:Plant transposase [Cucumis melo var. makuwa]|uniref:Plant transposase n=1 Tax=Cucumis melo var. makuwa TaxID=1194695 RepID=A0A5D3BM96_CUCMM|nr:Plant transposase [Cucumis melo var. makuwa]